MDTRWRCALVALGRGTSDEQHRPLLQHYIDRMSGWRFFSVALLACAVGVAPVLAATPDVKVVLKTVWPTPPFFAELV